MRRLVSISASLFLLASALLGCATEPSAALATADGGAHDDASAPGVASEALVGAALVGRYGWLHGRVSPPSGADGYVELRSDGTYSAHVPATSPAECEVLYPRGTCLAVEEGRWVASARSDGRWNLTRTPRRRGGVAVSTLVRNDIAAVSSTELTLQRGTLTWALRRF